ncbi:MAG TPA: DUF4091 domain-containing protein [Kiritimatiellia bacterium]|nr:DUF4091 domain-containing protein [Kiritimatiellia bacterium]HPS08145.1 DUF4091 domain-containing protein [Kiritimatiellia bacterium]
MKDCSEVTALLIGALLAGVALGAQTLVNGGFEDVADGKVKGWHACHAYVCATGTVHSGASAIRCESADGKSAAGVMQEIVYAKPDKSPVLFGGWSKADGVAASEYCVYLDIWYEGGGNAWGVTTDWSQPTHDWEYAAEIFYPEKPIQKIQYFVFLRKGAGRVWFDELFLERRQPALGVKTMRAVSDFPITRNGVQATLEFWKRAEWRCRVVGADGRERESFSGSGTRAVVAAEGGPGTMLHVSAKAGNETFEQPYVLPAFSGTRGKSAKKACAVWTADSMRRVTPLTDPTEAETSSPEIVLELARNECESAQVLVTAGDAGPVADVTVELAAFTDADGTRFDGEVTWQRVGYIRRQRPCHPHPCGVSAEENWLPDPLLPPAPFTVRASATQGVWLTARAGKGAKPGVYGGQVVVKAGKMPLRIFPMTLRVRDFNNPQTFGMPTAFCVMDGFTRAQYPDRFEEMKRKTHDLMLSHRLNPDDISRTEPPCIEDLVYAREKGMNRFNILNLVPKPAKPCKWVCYAPLSAYTPAFYEEIKARLTPYVTELRRHGLEKSAYLYGFDERPYAYYPAIGELWRKLKTDFPDIPVMTTAMMYRDMRDGKSYPEQDITDWFCPLTSVYAPALSEKLRARGRQVWWYVCCGPTWPQANFASLEYPVIEGRLLGWLTYRYRADGLLFWHVNLWPDRPPLKTDDTFLDAWQAENSLKMPGDGQLLYPGADGPLPSIRLALVRDGIEDYEWLQLLERKTGRSAAEAATARLIRSMTDFERSPDALRNARAQIADALERR